MSARESLERACKDYYKVLTHDLRPPIQGGEPLWADGGGYPIRLPAVVLDMSAGMCDQGWCACGGPHEALKIAGLWPDGWPSRLFAVRSESEWLERGCGLRTAGPLIVEREMLMELCAKFGTSISELLRGLVHDKYTKTFPAYMVGKKYSRGSEFLSITADELSPEQAC